MPPFVARKRRQSTPPPLEPPRKSAKKPSLFDAVDSPQLAFSVQESRKFLDSLGGSGSDTSLSDVGSSEFEDAIVSEHPAKRQKVVHHEEADDEVDWEDAMQADTTAGPPPGDLEITLDKGVQVGSLTNPHDKKKGPSKIERQIRNSTHCMHVQFLMFHNLIRNAWVCDKEVQDTLLGQLPKGVHKEIERWRITTGLAVPELAGKDNKSMTNGKRKSAKAKDQEKNQRDWGKLAERQEQGAPNMSQADPLIRLLKVLAAYWKKRFTITAPGLRKQGYKSLAVLEAEIASSQNDKRDIEEHGEQILGNEQFRKHAKSCEGSRDVGAQLFAALVRSLGLEARLVASLQPVGFGWNKNEVASTKRKRFLKQLDNDTRPDVDSEEARDSVEEGVSNDDLAMLKKSSLGGKKVRASKTNPKTRKTKARATGHKEAPIDLSDDIHILSDESGESVGDDDGSVIDVTPSLPRKKPNLQYDRDLPFPIYWVEVASPITSRIYPVDPLILTPAVASNPEHVAAFEPRGSKADKAKQVIAYVVAFSADGTAKEVTTRYLKRHMWPGKTKGVRMPVEKIPVYNRRGKVKRYEEYDWFKTVMSTYRRSDNMRTAVDDLEDTTDLQPVKPEKKAITGGEETLQGYKSSAEYILERHLRREEALTPDAKPVKCFTAGKGDKSKEEPVFRRKDVVICRTGESWHKEGRQVKNGEHPMKMVPVRAVTLTRKREVEEAERDGGEKLKQGMYAWDQTEWIIPPPIENGIIPKNAFGNMDCFVPTLVPEGAAHVPLRSTVKICKRLDIDYAEAVTGFEFGKQRAVPVITGVIVAAEHERLVIEEWEKDEKERKIKEEGKREKVALAMWRKFLMGLRIVERVKAEYGNNADDHLREELNPFTNRKRKNQAHQGANDNAVEDDRSSEHAATEDFAGGFLVDDASDTDAGGGLCLSEDEAKFTTCIKKIMDKNDEASPKSHNTTTDIASHPNDARELSPTPTEEDLHTQTRKLARKSRGRKIAEDTLKSDRSNNKTNGPRLINHISDSLEAGKTPPTQTKLTTRTAPNRAAARKSSTAIKSHYFTHDSESDEGSDGGSEASSEDETKPKSKKPKRKPLVKGATRGRKGRKSV